MAKTKKQRETEIMEYKIAKEEQLITNWGTYNISQKKIDALTAKKVKHEADLVKVKNK